MIRSATVSETRAIATLADEIENAKLSLLPGDVSPCTTPGFKSFNVQPDLVIESPNIYCLVEVKRIKQGSFQPTQLARELVVALQQLAHGSPCFYWSYQTTLQYMLRGEAV